MTKLNFNERLKSHFNCLCSESKTNTVIEEDEKVDDDEIDSLEEQRLFVNRPLLNHKEFKKLNPSSPPDRFKFSNLLGTCCKNNIKPNKRCAKKKIYDRFPIIRILRHYKKENILSDFFVGITVNLKLIKKQVF